MLPSGRMLPGVGWLLEPILLSRTEHIPRSIHLPNTLIHIGGVYNALMAKVGQMRRIDSPPDQLQPSINSPYNSSPFLFSPLASKDSYRCGKALGDPKRR